MKEHSIKQDRLIALLKAEAKLECLEGGGVDNWCGYDEALNPDWEDCASYDEICREIEEQYND